jgi:hypothetical protein
MNKNILLVVSLVVLIAVAFFFLKKKKSAPVSQAEPASETKKNGTIYGSMGCQYTVKQIEKYPDFTFVDCTKDKCPDFVSAFPTTVYPDGSIVPGYKA